jgi:hypothetical protein
VSNHQLDLCTHATHNLRLVDHNGSSEIIPATSSDLVNGGSHQPPNGVNLNKRKLRSTLSANQLAEENDNSPTTESKSDESTASSDSSILVVVSSVDPIVDQTSHHGQAASSTSTKPPIPKRFFLDETTNGNELQSSPASFNTNTGEKIDNGEVMPASPFADGPRQASSSESYSMNSPVGSHANGLLLGAAAVESECEISDASLELVDETSATNGGKELLSFSLTSKSGGEEYYSPININTSHPHSSSSSAAATLNGKHIKTVQRFPRTNFPLSSSPAPIRKSGSAFDFDKSLKHPKSIKK